MKSDQKSYYVLVGGIHKLAIIQQTAGIEFQHTGLYGGNSWGKSRNNCTYRSLYKNITGVQHICVADLPAPPCKLSEKAPRKQSKVERK